MLSLLVLSACTTTVVTPVEPDAVEEDDVGDEDLEDEEADEDPDGATWELRGESRFTIPAGAATTAYALPGPPVAGDLVLIAIGSVGGMTGPTEGVLTSGYITDLETSIAPGAETSYKVMRSPADTDVRVGSVATWVSAVIIQTWSGGNAASPVSVHATTASSKTGDPDPPPITPTHDGSLIVAIAVHDDDLASVSAFPSGFSNAAAQATAGAGHEVGATVMLASKALATAAAEDPRAFEAPAEDEWHAITYAFRPGG